MRLLSTVLFLFTCISFSCSDHVATTADDHYIILHHDDTTKLKTGDSAAIYLSYPQGTAYYQYCVTDTGSALTQTSHHTNEGDPNESGGGMGEEFHFSAKTKGQGVIVIRDEAMMRKDSTRGERGAFRYYYEVR